MNYSRRVEANLAEFYELVPNLPKHVRVWLANNTWRITLVGILACVVSMIWMIPAFVTAVVLSSGMGELLSPSVPYENPQLNMTWLSMLITIIVTFITSLILLFSLNAIRRKSKAGWDGLFGAIVLNICRAVVVIVITPTWTSFATLVVCALVTGYLLFEIRKEFHHTMNTRQEHIKP